MNTNRPSIYFKILIFFSCLLLSNILFGQVNVQVRVNSGNSSTTCTDGFFGGSPEPHWRVEIAGQGWTTYPQAGLCFTNPPNTQYDEDFICSYPNQLQVCFRAFEDDGGACIVSEDCVETVCQNFAVPAPGGSNNYTLSVGGSSSGSVNFTITTSGSLPYAGNDLCTGAIDLGGLPLGGTIGGDNFNNYCSGSAGDPNPGWTVDQGVWFEFTTSATPGTVTTIDASNTGGDNINLQLALYEGTCSGLSLVAQDYDGAIPGGETMEVECLSPNTTYYVLVDGEEYLLLNAYVEGIFDLDIIDNGITQATNDLVCDAIDMGTISIGGTLGNENNFIYNNYCATNTGDPNPANWTNQWGVWTSFTTGAQVGSVLTIEVNSAGVIGDLNVEASVFEAPNGCTDIASFIEVADSDDFIDLSNSETIEFQCPQPNTTYYILVDGESNPLDVANLFDEEHGEFGIGIYDDGYQQASDFICGSYNMGPIPAGGTVNAGDWSNVCATQNLSSSQNDPIPGFNWDNDPAEQQGVWFEFQAPPSGSVNIYIESEAGIGTLSTIDEIDVYVAVYTTLDDVCDPSFQTSQLQFVDEQNSALTPCGVTPPNDLFDESFDVKCLEPGQSYWIFVDGDSNALLFPNADDGVDGYFNLTVTDLGDPPAPNNDICNAIAIDGGVQLAPGASVTLTDQNNYCADNFYEPYQIQGSNDSADFTNENGVWYTFVAPVSGAVNITAENIFQYNCGVNVYDDAIRIELAVFEASSPIQCTGIPATDQNDNNVTLVHAESEEIDDALIGGIGPLDVLNDEHAFVDCLIPGETYYLLVDGFPLGALSTDFAEGSFDLTLEAVDQPAPTANDTPCEAVALGALNGTFPTLFNNYCATTEPSDPIIQNTLGFDVDHYQTVWFTFEAPPSGTVIVEGLNTGSDDIDLQVGVYLSDNGTCTGNMVELASDYDPLNFDEELPPVFCLVPGETYYIMVDGIEQIGLLDFSVEGDFQISITEDPNTLSMPNDEICNATSFPGSPFGGSPQTLTLQHNLCAQNFNDSIPSAFNPDHTVWYEFTTPPGTGFAVDVTVQSLENFITILNGDSEIMDPQIAVFGSDDGTCNGNLYEVESSYNPLSVGINPPDIGFNESMTVQCLEPSTTYWIMVDGSIVNYQGFFDITIEDNTDVLPVATNDECIDAIALGQIPYGGSIPPDTLYNNFCAETTLGEPDPAGYDIDQTVWFTFQTPDDFVNDISNVTINLESDGSDNIDLQVAVYSGNCTSGLTEVDSEYDPGFFGETIQLTCLEPSETYYIQVDGSASLLVEGYFTVEIIDDGATSSVPNDNICSTATPLGTVPDGAGTIGGSFSNLCAGIEPNEPNPGWGLGTDGINNTVWFTFTPPSSGNVLISGTTDQFGAGDGVDLQFAVYYSNNNSCDPTQLIPVDYEWNAPDWDEDLYISCLDPSLTYYLQVDGSTITEAAQTGDFDLAISDDAGSSVPPYNNNICNAGDFGTINTSETLTGETNVCANLELNEPGTFGYAQHTVWYEFIAPPSGHITIEVDPASIIDMLPEIYLFGTNGASCDYNDLELITQDVFPNTAIEFILETSCIIPGDTYYIQVDGQLATQGQFDITITDLFPNYASTVEPSNNECVNAIPLMVQEESCFVGDGVWDNANYGQPTISINDPYVQSCANQGNCGDTWYCFELPQTGTVLIEGNDQNVGTNSDDSELVVIAYSGTCNSLTPINCEAGGSGSDVSFEVQGAPGSKVWLQVFDDGGDDHGEDFQLCVSDQCGADNCLFAVAMEPDSVYCWNTASAGGEDISAGEPGYEECGDNSNTEHSIYFSFTSDCAGGIVTVTLSDIIYDANDPSYIPCDNTLGVPRPEDGFTFTVIEDSTPCDGVEDAVIYCEVFTGCEYNTNATTQEFTFTDLNPFTEYIIQIDGGIYNALDGEVGGNVQGNISIQVLDTPNIDSMIVIDSIPCFGGTGTLTAEVSEGIPPYTFNWDDVSSDSIYTNVSAGWHYVTVTASNDCGAIDSIFLPEPPELLSEIEFDSTQVCYNNSVTAIAHPTGGTPEYTFVWTNGETDSIATTLSPGQNIVTITDANGCEVLDTIDVPAGTLQFVR